MTQENDLLNGNKPESKNITEAPKKKGNLRGKALVKEDKRLKLFLFGEAGTGKTSAAIQFPNNYIIDAEKGTHQYYETVTKNNSVVFDTTSYDETYEEVKTLMTTEHDFKTLTIDPITIIYEDCQFKYEKLSKGPGDMSRWPKITGAMNRLYHMLLEIDMNIIVTAHAKPEYSEGFIKVGTTFDSKKGSDYPFDYMFELVKVKGSKIPRAITRKQRAEIGKPKFPDDFEWSYDNFLKFYGIDMISKPATPKKLADDELIKDFILLLDIVKVGSDVLTKWGISDTITLEEKNELADLEYDALKKRVDFLKSKLPKE